MKNAQIHTKWRSESVPALIKERDLLKKKSIMTQLEVSFGKLKRNTDLRVQRKNIARLETIIQEKLIAAGKQSGETQ